MLLYPFPHLSSAGRQWIGRLERLLGGTGLAGRIALNAAALMLLVLAVGGITSLLISASLLQERIEGELKGEARLIGQRIQMSLGNLQLRIESMAANPLTSNSLTDTTLGRDAYLRPFLQKDNLVHNGISLALLDFSGAVVSSAGTPSLSVENIASASWFRAALEQKKTQILLFETAGDPGYRVRLVAPVIYPASSQAEGALLLEGKLSDILDLRPTKEDKEFFQYTYVMSRKNVVVGLRPDRKLFKISQPLMLNAPYSGLDLTFEIGIERWSMLRPLLRLVGSYALAGLIALCFVLWVVRRISKRLTAPLAKLADNADAISSSGRLDMEFAYDADDEIGRLGQSFGAMLGRLGAVQSDLERRVAERTEELRQSEAKLSSLLRSLPDIVFSLSPDCGSILYSSAATKRVLDIDSIAPGSSIRIILDRIHPADRPAMKATLDRLQLNGDAEYTVRVHTSDADLRWLNIRMHSVFDQHGAVIRFDGIATDITERKRVEEALLAARQFAQSTLDGLTAHICVLDESGTILSVNEAWRQFGRANGADPCSMDEGTNYLGVCSPEVAEMPGDSQAIVDGVRDVLSGKSDLFEMEYACHSPTEQRWFLVRVSRLKGGGPGRVVVAHENITRRKLAENALRASEERWRFALEGAGDGVWDWNVQSANLILSKRWKEILDYGEGEVGGHLSEWESRVHPEDKARVMTALESHLECHDVPYLAEYRLRGKNGWKWVLDRGMVVARDDGGMPLRMLGTISDISTRKAIEAALQDRNEQLDTIFSLSPDGFVSFDREGRIKFANSAFFRMTGIGPESILNQPEARLDHLLRSISAEGDSYPGLESYCGAEDDKNRQRHFLTLAEPRASVLEIVGLRSRAQSVSRLLYFRDVTHETEVDRMKSEFLASAAHELRTPMAGIYGFTELLLNDEFDEETRRDVLQTIYQQTDMLVKIINELLDLARIEARRGKDFRLESLDPLQLIRDSVASVQVNAGKWPIVFSLPSEAPRIRGDRNKLHQALLNVLGNACKYSPDGGAIAIRVECADRAGRGREVCFAIRDCGIGMTAEQSARIFERFYRADASGKIPGTGLGMSIVKEIIDLHGGRIDVDSTFGVGTEIRLWLPVSAEPVGPRAEMALSIPAAGVD